jgi:integrase
MDREHAATSEVGRRSLQLDQKMRTEAQHSDGAAGSGGDCSVIVLWLGHESIDTTQIYLHVHLARKEAALAMLKPYERRKRVRFKPSDSLLAFLEAL